MRIFDTAAGSKSNCTLNGRFMAPFRLLESPGTATDFVVGTPLEPTTETSMCPGSLMLCILRIAPDIYNWPLFEYASALDTVTTGVEMTSTSILARLATSVFIGAQAANTCKRAKKVNQKNIRFMLGTPFISYVTGTTDIHLPMSNKQIERWQYK